MAMTDGHDRRRMRSTMTDRSIDRSEDVHVHDRLSMTDHDRPMTDQPRAHQLAFYRALVARCAVTPKIC